MIIYQVEPQHIDLVWSSVAPLLKKPLETGLDEVIKYVLQLYGKPPALNVQ